MLPHHERGCRILLKIQRNRETEKPRNRETEKPRNRETDNVLKTIQNIARLRETVRALTWSRGWRCPQPIGAAAAVVAVCCLTSSWRPTRAGLAGRCRPGRAQTGGATVAPTAGRHSWGLKPTQRNTCTAGRHRIHPLIRFHFNIYLWAAIIDNLMDYNQVYRIHKVYKIHEVYKIQEVYKIHMVLYV